MSKTVDGQCKCQGHKAVKQTNRLKSGLLQNHKMNDIQKPFHTKQAMITFTRDTQSLAVGHNYTTSQAFVFLVIQYVFFEM